MKILSLVIFLLFLLSILHVENNQVGAATSSQPDDFARHTYSSNELFSNIGHIESKWGHASVAMFNGYLIAVYSSDGGGNLDDGGIDIFDISNPRQPIKVRSIEAPITHELREAHSLSFSSYNGRDFMVLQAMHGLQIWDVTEAPEIWPAHYMILPGIREDDYFGAWWAFWQAPYIYLAGVEQGLYIIDASDISNPQLVNQVPTSQLGGINPAQVFVVGNMMIIGTNLASELATIDISDPVNPKLLHYYKGYDAYSHLFAAGKIFGAGGRNEAQRLNIYDVGHDGKISEFGVVGEGVIQHNGGYGSYQDGYYFGGFSSGVFKIDVEEKRIEGYWERARTHRDYDFGQVLGNLVFGGEDHEGISELIVHQTEPDTKGPEVHWIHPADGASNLATTTRVGLSMSDNVNIESVDIHTFKVRPVNGEPLLGKYSSQNGIVNFFPDKPLLNNLTYEVVVEGIEDYSGNPAPKFISQFSTGDPASVELACTLSFAPAEVDKAITLTGPTNPAGTHYRWSFGDGALSGFGTSKSTTKIYKNPGRYRVQLTVQRGNQQETCVGIQIVTRPTTEKPPIHSGSLILAGNQLVVANPDNDTVTAIDKETLVKNWEAAVCDRPETVALVTSNEIWVACGGSDQVYRLNAASGGLVGQIAFAYGSQPHSIIVSPDKDAVFVSLYGSGELAKLSLAGELVEKIAVGPTPRSLSMSGDGRIFVSRYISDKWSGTVTEVDGSTMENTRIHSLAFDPGPDHESGGRGVPNYVGQIAIAPDGLSAIVPSKKDNVVRGAFRDGQTLTFESMVRPIVSKIDLEANVEKRLERIDLDNEALPQAAVYSPLGDLFFVANVGSDSVHVYDAVSGQIVSEVSTDSAPQSLVIDEENRRLIVHNYLSRTLTVYDIGQLLDGISNGATSLEAVNLVANEALTADELLGKQIFYDASEVRMAKDNYISCAVCHIGGGTDGRIWDSSQDGEGLRLTPSLHGRAGLAHGNLHWSGAFDEVQDVENEIRGRFGGSGFLSPADFALAEQLDGPKKSGRSADLDALAAYVSSLSTVSRSPYRTGSGELTSTGLSGRSLFINAGCATCHSGETFTDSASGGRHQIGSLGRGSGQFEIDTPTLRGLWETAPYLHNGSAATLNEAIEAHVWTSFTDAELDLLSSYLNQIDDQEPAAQITTPNLPPVIGGDWAERTSTVGEAISIQLAGTDDAGLGLTYGGVGLPTGLSIDAETGMIAGTTSTKGRYGVKLFAKDAQGGADVVQFDWLVGDVQSFNEGETHQCQTGTACTVELGWIRLEIPASTFKDDVELQVTFDSAAGDGLASAPDDAINRFWILATNAQTGKPVSPLRGQAIQVTYRLDKNFYHALSTFHLALVRGSDLLEIETSDGSVTFELSEMGEIGLIIGRNIVYLPIVYR